MIKAETITELVNGHLEGTAFFLVEVTVKTGNRITVYLDGDQGAGIEVCREVNHFLNERLDRDAEDYDLTVSSAGIDRPVKWPRQYNKLIGRELEVVNLAGEKVTGTLMTAGPGEITIQVTPDRRRNREALPQTIQLQYTDIKTAREIIKF